MKIFIITPFPEAINTLIENNIANQGIKKNLLEVEIINLRDFAKDNGFRRLELSTAKDNHIGQSLYESLGYELDEEFLHYSLDVD